jgi:hypothetical protein
MTIYSAGLISRANGKPLGHREKAIILQTPRSKLLVRTLRESMRLSARLCFIGGWRAAAGSPAATGVEKTRALPVRDWERGKIPARVLPHRCSRRNSRHRDAQPPAPAQNPAPDPRFRLASGGSTS